MAENKVVRVTIGNPSYKGPHKDCFGRHYEFMFALGRLSERSKAEDVKFEFNHIPLIGNSLIGQARDIIVERALWFGSDYVFFFDDDMQFEDDTFIRLWQRQKPFVGALAFTAREPIVPVLYRFVRKYDFNKISIDIEPILDYPEDKLFRVDAMGTGVVLISTDVFRQLEGPPWFNGSVSMGEDVYFGWKMYQAGIPVYCDTSVKTSHAPNEPQRWHDEAYYLEQKVTGKAKEFYDAKRKVAHDRNSKLAELESAS